MLKNAFPSRNIRYRRRARESVRPGDDSGEFLMKGYEKVGPRQRNKLLCRCVRCGGMFRGFQTPGCFSLHLKDDLASVDELMEIPMNEIAQHFLFSSSQCFLLSLSSLHQSRAFHVAFLQVSSRFRAPWARVLVAACLAGVVIMALFVWELRIVL